MRFKRTGLWLHGDFLRLWTGETVSVFGDMVGNSALAFTAVLVLRANALQIGMMAAVHLVPDVFLGLVAGVWVDRLRKRPLMIIADVGRFASLLTIPIAYALTLVAASLVMIASGLWLVVTPVWGMRGVTDAAPVVAGHSG